MSYLLMNCYIIMKLITYCLIFAAIVSVSKCDPFGDLKVVPTSFQIQAKTDYVFTLTLDGDGMSTYLIPIGSDVAIYFPSEYPLLPANAHTCSIISWPTAFSAITCSLAYQTLTIKNAFTAAITIGLYDTYTFKWIVNAIDNPVYSQTTSYFSGKFIYNNSAVFSEFSPSNYLGLTITPGSLVVSMSVSPTTTDSASNLTFVVSPSHSIPVGGCLKITFSSTWSTAIYSTSTILSSQSACLGVTNTASNLGCTYVLAPPNYVVTVTNIYTNQSSTQFSFNLTNFLNPPSTQPVNNFILQTYNSTGSTAAVIDSSSGNVIAGVTASPILSVKMYLSDSQQGKSVQANITVTITNTISTSDVFYIESPSEIDLSAVTSVKLASQSVNSLSVLTGTKISFKSRFEMSNPYPMNITIDKMLLPAYATTISSPFLIYVKRNSYYVCYVSSSFNIVLTSGGANVTLGPSSSVAGVGADYNFSMSFDHSLSSTSKLSFYFNFLYFSAISNISCQSSMSINCTVANISSNVVEISSVTSSTTSKIDVVLTGLTNPSTVGTFTPISISSYNNINGVFYLVDSNMLDAFFSLLPRPMTLLDMNLSSTSYKVYSTAIYTVSIRNQNSVPSGAYFIIYVPADITYSTIVCSVVCTVGIFGGKRGIKLEQIGPLTARTISTFTIQNMVNPISTKSTSPFGIEIYNSNNKLLQYLNSGVSFKCTIPSSMLMSISTTSNRNSQKCSYNVTYSTNYEIGAAVALVLTMPNTQACPSCVAQIYNSSHNQFIFYSQSMTNNLFTLTLSDINNYYCYEPQTITGAILSNDLLYSYANGSTSMTTNSPSVPSLSYEFTKHQLGIDTDLLIHDIASATLLSRVAKIVIIFGTDFDITGAICSSVGYSCSIASGQISFGVTSLGNLSTITVKNIVAPSLSPSTTIKLSTYSTTGYLIDTISTIVWSANCQLPCKTCLSSNFSSCLSCYSDVFISAGRVLFFSANSTCVSQCGDRYYKNYSLNTCQLCSSDCANCVNFSQCVSCVSGKYLLVSNATCYRTCPTGYFPHLTNCVGCTASLNCYTCSDQVSCSSCEGSFYYYRLQCLSLCPQNITITNITTNKCDSCPENCSTCYLSSSTVVTCSACISGYLDNGRCVVVCETVGTVPEGLFCTACNDNCLTCSGSPTFCLTCNSSAVFAYFLGNKCYSQCPATYYNDNSTLSCLPCTKPCETCSGYSSNACLSCISNYSLLGNICQSSCPEKYYSNSTACLPCQQPCLTCFGLNDCFVCSQNYSLISSNFTCLSGCPDGYISINQVCQPCSSNCLTCVTQTICQSCPVNSYLYNGSCINPCVAGYYANNTIGQCVKCPYSCSNCLNYTYCSGCVLGYELQSNFTCTSLCPNHQVPISGICINCTTGCSGCQFLISNCTGCNSGYYYAPSTFSCYVNCPSTLYLSTTDICAVSCATNNYVVVDNTTNVSICVSCPQYCTSCISDSQCGGCLAGTYSYSGLCYASCPVEAQYHIGSICQSCNVVDCFSCSGPSCTMCNSGRFLIGTSLCISGCSANQVYNSVTKACDTIAIDPAPTSTTTITSTTSNGVITFFPLPYLIVMVVVSVFVVIMHFKDKISAIPVLYGISGFLLTLSNLTLLIVGLISEEVSSGLAKGGLYCLMVAQLLVVFGGILSAIFWIYHLKCQKWLILCFSIFHFSTFSLLTSNFDHYNSYFIDEHKPFWRKYRLLSKIGLFVVLIFEIGGGLQCFGVENHLCYSFFAGVEVCLLAFFVLVLEILWVWLPLKQPLHEEVVSEKSTENLFGSEVDKHTEYSHHQQTKLRGVDVKTEGEKIIHEKDRLSMVHSNFEFNSIKDVLKVKTDEIADAIEKGLFRRSEQQILKEQQHKKEMSNLDSAMKMNRFMQKGHEIKEEDSPDKIKPIAKQSPMVNIFQIEEGDFHENMEGHQAERNFHSPKGTHEQDLDSAQNAMLDEPLSIKEADFKYNIIFEEPEEDNITHYEEESSKKSNSPEFHMLVKENSLGDIFVHPEEVKVESRQTSGERLPSPILVQTKQGIQKIQIQDFSDEFIDSRKELFHSNANRIKPMHSKQMNKVAISPADSPEKKQDLQELQKQIIHADLEEIITVQEGNSIQFLEESDIIYKDSGRKLVEDRKKKEVINDLEKPIKGNFSGFIEQDRPGSFLRQAAVNYQPGVQKNVAPLLKKQKVSRRKK